MRCRACLILWIVCLIITFASCADYVEPGEGLENERHEHAANNATTQQADMPTDVAETKDNTDKDTDLYPSDCEYCGKLDGENRWFLAKVIDSNTVKPIGENCMEAVSAGEAGFEVNFFGDNLIEKQGLVAGDTVRIIYNGYIVETYPCQIYPESIESIEP